MVERYSLGYSLLECLSNLKDNPKAVYMYKYTSDYDTFIVYLDGRHLVFMDNEVPPNSYKVPVEGWFYFKDKRE